MARRLVGLGLALLLLVPATARAEDEPDPWLTSLAEAKRVASQERRLILVYLDPGWERGATTGSRDSLADSVLRKAAEQVLVVRLPATIDDPESEAVRARYGLFTDRSGAVVIDAEGARFWAGAALRPDLVLGGVAEAPAAARQYADRRRTLARHPDRASQLELARLHAAHDAFESAARLYVALDAVEPLECEDRAALAAALWITGDLEGAARHYERAVAAGGDHPDRIQWRIARATLDVSRTRTVMLQLGREDAAVRAQGERALRRLLAEVQAEGAVSAEAAVRRGLLHYVRGYAEFVAQPDWIVHNDPQGRYALDSWVRLMNIAVAWSDVAAAKRYAEAAIAAHPEDQGVVPWLREGMLPAFEKLLAAPDDPEREPFLLRVRVEPEAPGLADELYLRVEVENRSQRELRDVSVTCHLAGPAEFLTRRVGTLPRVEPKSAYELQYLLKRTGPEAIHLVVLLTRESAGEDLTERGTHVRIHALE